MSHPDMRAPIPAAYPDRGLAKRTISEGCAAENRMNKRPRDCIREDGRKH